MLTAGNKIGGVYVEISARLNKMTASFRKAQKDTKTFASKVQKSLDKIDFKQVGRRMTIMGGAVVAGFAVMGKSAMSFNDKLVRIQVQSGATASEMAKIRETALSSYFVKLGKNGSQVADMYMRLASEGYKVAEMEKMLIPITNVVTNLQTEEGETTKLMLNLMQQYNLQAKDMIHISDVLTGALANTSFQGQEIADVMKYAGLSASSLGWSLEATIPIVDAVIKRVGSATMSGTYFRQMIGKLQKPTAEMITELSKASISLDEVDKSLKDPIKLVKLLKKAYEGGASMTKMFGVRSLAAAQSLINTSIPALEEMTKVVNNEGIAQRTTNKISGNALTRAKSLGAVIKNLSIIITSGLLPSFKDFANKIIKIYEGMTAWIKANPQLTNSLAKITLAIGGLMLVLGPLMIFLSVVSFPVVGAIIGVTAVIAGLIAISSKKPLAKYEQTFRDVQKESVKLKSEFDLLTSKLELLTKKEKLSTEEMQLKKEIIQELNTKYPNYFKDLTTAAKKNDTLKIAISGAKDQLNEYTKAMLNQAVIIKYKDQLADLTVQFIDAKINLENLEQELVDFQFTEPKDMSFFQKEIEIGIKTENIKTAIELIPTLEGKVKKAREELTLAVDALITSPKIDIKTPNNKEDSNVGITEYIAKLGTIKNELKEIGKVKIAYPTLSKTSMNETIASLNMIKDVVYDIQRGLSDTFGMLLDSMTNSEITLANAFKNIAAMWKRMLINMVAEYMARAFMFTLLKGLTNETGGIFDAFASGVLGGRNRMEYTSGVSPNSNISTLPSNINNHSVSNSVQNIITINAIDAASFEQRLAENPDAIISIVQSNIANRGILSV